MASYYGQALMNIGSIIGSNMTRSIAEDERQQDRLELQRERERERAELQRERLAAQERQDALYRRTADQQTAGRSGGGGGRAREYTPDEQLMMAVESGKFGSQGDVDKFKAATKSGDFSGYQVDVTRGKVTDNGDPYNPEVTLSTAKEYPPGFDREMQAKSRVLANIARESVQGKDLKDVNEGRQKEFELGVGQGVLSGEMSMGRGSGAVASMAGKPIVDVKDGTAFNQYTGTSQTTEKGQSEIRKNNAQAGEAGARAKAASDGTSKVDIQGVAANAANLIKLADAAAADGDNVTAKRLRDEAARLSQEAGAKKVPKGEGGDKAPPAPTKLKVGDVYDGMRYSGGNPNDPKNWVKADGGSAKAAPESKPEPAPAPKPAAAPKREEPADSPSAKFQARQAELKAQKQAWDSEQKSKAEQAFASLNLADAQAAAQLQDSPLFGYLTTQQKAAVRKAVMGR